MIEWWIAKWMLVAAATMLALCAGVCLGRTMRRAAKAIAALRRQVAAALVALAVVCVGVAQKERGGGEGDDGRVERVERVEERDRGSGIRDETQTLKHPNTQTPRIGFWGVKDFSPFVENLWYNDAVSERLRVCDMSKTIDLPPTMLEEARECATVQETTLERMAFDCIKTELDGRRRNEVNPYSRT